MTDKESRNLLINDINNNYFVMAGAGSGKTTSLVLRMVKLIESGVDIKNICAITFTKKAADEFYDRFYKKLLERSSEEKENESGKFYQAALNIDLCFLGTIDSFCYKLLSEYPTYAKLRPNSILLEDKIEKMRFYEEIYSYISTNDKNSDLYIKFLSFQEFHKNPKDIFIDNIDSFLSRRNFNFVYEKPDSKFIEDTRNNITNIKKDIQTIFKIINDNKELVFLGETTRVEAFNMFNKVYHKLFEPWYHNDYYFLIKSFDKINEHLHINEELFDKIPDSLKEYFMPVTNRKKVYYVVSFKDDKNIIDHLENIRYSYTMDFLVNASKVITPLFIEKGYLTFSDNLIYLRDMLKEDMKSGGLLIDELQKKYKYFLIDESQDTNPIQSEIFFYLSSSNKKEIWNENIPNPGSLFIVGDPKQSIYRFQNADITSYFNVGRLFKDGTGEILSLTNNFRSSNRLKNYFNSLFNEMFVEDPDMKIQSKYEEIENVEPDSYKEKILDGLYHMISSDVYGSICSLINNIVDNDNILIKAKDNNGKTVNRKIKYSDIMIIPKTKINKISKISSELNKHNIPSFCEGEIDFYNSKALVAIYSIYSYVIEPNDKNLLLILNNVFGFDERDDLKIFLQNRKEEILAYPIFEIINKLIIESRNYTPSLLYEKILENINLFDYVDTSYIELIYNALELLRNSESSKDCNLFNGKEILKKIIFDKDIERISALSKDLNTVKVANLHKVKGLEAPICILPSLNKRQTPINSRFEVDTNEAYIFEMGKMFESKYFLTTRTNLYNDKQIIEKEFLDAEEIRLKYVAATRAMNAIFIFDEERKEITKNSYNSLTIFSESNKYILPFTRNIDTNENIITLDELLKERDLVETKETKCVIKNEEPKKFNDNNYNETYSQIRPSVINAKSSLDDIYSTIKYEKEEDDIKRTEIGTIIHSIMEKIVNSKFNVNIENLVQNSINDSFDESKIEELNELVSVMLNGGFVQEEDACPITDLFGYLKNKECYTEVPFSYMENDNLVYGIIDLIYKDDKGYHIIDYKTNKSSVGLMEHYKEQLDSYKKAFKELTSEDCADAYIYHIPA